MSGVTCHVSGVKCQCFLNVFFCCQSGDASRWRVCYQRGLPRQVMFKYDCGQIFNAFFLAFLSITYHKAELALKHEGLAGGYYFAYHAWRPVWLAFLQQLSAIRSHDLLQPIAVWLTSHHGPSFFTRHKELNTKLLNFFLKTTLR